MLSDLKSFFKLKNCLFDVNCKIWQTQQSQFPAILLLFLLVINVFGCLVWQNRNAIANSDFRRLLIFNKISNFWFEVSNFWKDFSSLIWTRPPALWIAKYKNFRKRGHLEIWWSHFAILPLNYTSNNTVFCLHSFRRVSKNRTQFHSITKMQFKLYWLDTFFFLNDLFLYLAIDTVFHPSGIFQNGMEISSKSHI